MQYDYSATHDSWLRQAIATKDKAKHLNEWQIRYEKVDSAINLNQFGFLPKLSDLNYLPSFSFMLRFSLKLSKPYLSKDDRSFHLLDHPVRKEKIFQNPMVASTSWKGVLRIAMIQQLSEWSDNLNESIRNDCIYKKEFVARQIRIEHLFGTKKDIQIDDKKIEQGCLYFYPTFFDQIGLEVINPHDRKKGTGKNPILIECVPVDAIGEFVLLYVPFGLVKLTEVARDLQMVAEGVEKMLTVYGFGAKTSSGFGIAEVNGIGELAIATDLPDLQPPEPKVISTEPELPSYLIAPGKLHPDLQNSDGNLKSEAEYLNKKSSKKEKQRYEKAKKWWEREGKALKQTVTLESAPEPEPSPPTLSITKVSFASLNELCDRAKQIGEGLCREPKGTKINHV